MFVQVLRALARNELAGIRRRAISAGFAMAAAFLLSLAFVFGFVALFLWLMTQVEPWQAASIVAAALIFGALLVWIVGHLVSRSSTRSRARADDRIQDLLDEASAAMKKDELSLASVSAAVAIGFAIGRRLTK